ncbi:MAG: PKD domain-containing protein [Bacteroidales bacterium]|nr:PKD domain-containing protein [Bacteroidales bacterium]
MKRNILFTLSSILIMIIFNYNQSEAQTVVYSGENVICTGDSVVLYASEYRGTIQWQQSADSINWVDIEGAVCDSLGINPTEDTYYRTKITEGTCLPIYTGIVKVTVNESTVITSVTTVIDNTDWQNNFISISEDNTIFTFNSNLNASNVFEPGDIFISGVDEGHLRKVESIEIDGDNVIYTTSNATIEEAITEGTGSYSGELLPVDKETGKKATINYLREGVSIVGDKGNDKLNYDIDVDICSGVNVSGNFSIIPSISFDIATSWSNGVYYVNVEENITEELNLTGTVTLLDINYSEEVQISTITFTPFTIWIGYVPVVVTPVLKTFVGVNLLAHSDITSSIEQSLSYTAGITYNQGYGWSSYSSHSESFDYNPPEMTNNGSLEVYIKPKLEFELYGVFGPHLYAKLYSELDVNTANSPWWQLFAGLDVGAGIDMSAISSSIPDYEVSLFNVEELIAQGSVNNPTPTADFTVSPLNGTTETNFTFDGSGSSDEQDPTSALEVRWDWTNNGSYDTGWSTTKTASHQYTSAGTYSVKMEVRDTEGLTDTEVHTVTVNNPNTPPTAEFTIDPSSGTTETNFEFDATYCTDAETPISSLQVRWDWTNDGTYDTDWSYSKMPSHQYSTEGTYTVNLEVRDGGGLTDTQTHQVSVGTSNTPPTAAFTIDPTTGTTATNFNFDASGCSDAQDPTSALQVRWDWDNDGTFETSWSTDKTALHQYSVDDYYTIALEVKDTEGMISSITHSVTVGVANTAPNAAFTISPSSGTTATNFSFDGSGSSDGQDPTSALEVRWDWTNNGSWDTNWSTTKTASHQYSSASTYTVKMEVKDTEGLTDDVTHTVSVGEVPNQPPVAIIEFVMFTGTHGVIVDIGDSYDPDGDDIYAKINWGDGNTTYFADFGFNEHFYSSAGYYTITLTVLDDEDQDTDTLGVNVP